MAQALQDNIQSGQAFIVQAFGSDGTISFKESDKASGSSLVTGPCAMPVSKSIKNQFVWSKAPEEHSLQTER